MRQHRLMGWGCALLLTACSEALPPEIDPGEAQPGQAIQVGGVVMPGLSVQVETKAQTETPAEQVPWLKKPLADGLDVFYGLREKFHDNTENAKLRWKESEGTGGTGEYTFYKAGTKTPAQWLGNGSHLFRGVYVPSAVRAVGETAPTDRLWVKDQSPEATTENPTTTNYDHLNHYLAMRANLQIAAPLGRIQLPSPHRLARVLTVVLIDPELSIEEGHAVTLKGYELKDGKDNPASTWIRMDRVDVLDYVSSSPAARAEGAVTMWHPRWTTARNVTPHFFGVVGSLDKDFNELYKDLLVFRDTKTDDLYFPTTDGWHAMMTTYKACYDKYKDTYPVQAELEAQIKKETGLTCINYGKAPCYDLILRPTYTSEAMVMYDEAENIDQGDTRKKLAAKTNGITYMTELSNGLRYSERIEIDLDAGYQTVVYLRIDREQVDFNQTVAEEWRMVEKADGYYGVNNQHGDRLSIAGGSWQRAYRVGTLDVTITDGSQYNENNNPDHYQDQKPGETHRDGQYLSEDSWKNAFFEAKEGDKHHGDYFVLTQDITIDVTAIPADFVFTGHLDGRGHTITLTGTRPSDSGTTGGGTEEGGTTPGEGGSSGETGGSSAGTGTEGAGTEGSGTTGGATPGEGNALNEEGGASSEAGGSSAGTGTEGAGTTGGGSTGAGSESGSTGSTEGSGSTGSGSTGSTEGSGTTGSGTTGGTGSEGSTEGSGSTGSGSTEGSGTTGGSEAGGTTPEPVRYLFDGLNGTYEAAAGTANVHEENNGTLVPLKGYRAELMNVTIKGGHLFSPAATTKTGYVVGCSDESKQPVDRNPGLGGSD